MKNEQIIQYSIDLIDVRVVNLSLKNPAYVFYAPFKSDLQRALANSHRHAKYSKECFL